jgi:hypothetical protein
VSGQVGKSDHSTNNHTYASYVMQSNQLVMAFTAPYGGESSVSGPSETPHPNFNKVRTAARHGAGHARLRLLPPTLRVRDIWLLCCACAVRVLTRPDLVRQEHANMFFEKHGLAVKAIGILVGRPRRRTQSPKANPMELKARPSSPRCRMRRWRTSRALPTGPWASCPPPA